ncbi:MAG: carbamoyltransferase C-terminal domain-containing protein [Planctomycetota bacterium]|nr:carbamoyltransferase C-terminal domain-containing protein [Planctomycetota bacterium]
MSTNGPLILGINAYDHDVSACLVRDGQIVAAISKERLTRVKHDAGFYGDVVTYCLIAGGVTLDEIDLVVRNSYLLPVAELEARLRGRVDPTLLPALGRQRALQHPLFGTDAERVVPCSHHLAHAYSAFAYAPFEDGAVMVVDGVGSYRRDVLEAVPEASEASPLAREAESYYVFEGTDLRTVEKVWLEPRPGFVNEEFHEMDGIGGMYSRVSTYVFGDWNRCGEVMGLASYGRDGMDPLMELEDGRLVVHPWPASADRPFEGGNDKAWNQAGHRAHWEDICHRVQEDTETILLERARRLHERTGKQNLVIAGGVGLNCVANGRLLRESPFERIFIQPAAGDDGIAIGCAMYGHLALSGGKRTYVMNHAYLGRPYADAQIESAMDRPLVTMSSSRRRSADVAADTAELLAKGAVVGWFQGGSEFGPRALGNRSILADPRDPKMADHVNERVKHRQPFRPFAPVVPVEHASTYFEGDVVSPFMLLAFDVKPAAREQLPSITHVDGTARVQTVRREDNPRLHALLTAFGELTGVPVLLNTSFNDRGEPLVETPGDAVRCYLGTGLDALVLGDWIVRKRGAHRMLRPVIKAALRAEVKRAAGDG